MSLQITFDKYVIKPVVRVGFSDLEPKGTTKIKNIPDKAQGSAAGSAQSDDNQKLNRKVDHYVK